MLLSGIAATAATALVEVELSATGGVLVEVCGALEARTGTPEEVDAEESAGFEGKAEADVGDAGVAIAVGATADTEFTPIAGVAFANEGAPPELLPVADAVDSGRSAVALQSLQTSARILLASHPEQTASDQAIGPG
jgi:hypothetical protein